MFRWSRFQPPNLRTILIVVAFFAISAVGSHISGSESRKLDEVDVSKCGGCPCSNPCTPIYPSPPPPSLPSPPPPPKKSKPYTAYCPPPPSPPSNFIYITGPPGQLYPIDQTYGRGHRSFAEALPAAIGGGLVALFMLW